MDNLRARRGRVPASPFFYSAILICLLTRAGWTQPLLLIGKADAELSGAFSYGILKSPLDYPFGRGRAQASFNLPINVSTDAQRFLGESSDSTLVMPELFARISQDLNAHVEVSAPVLGGTLFFAARENASLAVSGALGDARLNMDTTLESGGSVLMRGSIHMPLVFDMHWRSLTLGYAFQPAPSVIIAFQFHKHIFSARTSGDLRPDITGRITVQGEGANTSFLVEYPDNRVYGSARGDYQGTTWNPEMGVSVGPVRLVSRMGARMRAKGRLDIDYSVPFFVDPETFDMRFTEPDSFLAGENLGRLLNGETGRKLMKVDEDLILSLPASHSVALDLWPGRVSLSYTKVFGHLGIHGAGNGSRPSGADTATGIPEDSVITSTEGFADVDIFPDQVVCLSADFGWFHGNVGAHTLNVGYRGRKNLLSGLSPVEWDGDPWVPILNFGFAWGRPLRFNADIHVSPIPAVRTGVVYGF